MWSGKEMRKWILRFLTSCGLALVIGAVFTFWCHWQVSYQTQNRLYKEIEKCPSFHTGLVPGTSKFIRRGRINLFYQYRIDACVKAWKAGKIKYLIVSGDNGTLSYNEPEVFRQDLVAGGIDSAAIYLDYAGFRTLDSMVRAREIFGQDSLLVISQAFQCERALFIADRLGMKTAAFCAKDVPQSYGIQTQIREYLARVKVYVDFWLGTEPRFLGEKIKIPGG